MTCATVKDITAGLGQTTLTGRPLVGGLSFRGVSLLCMISLARWLSGGIQAKPYSGEGRTTACDPHALSGDQRVQQRGPDLEHSTTHSQDPWWQVVGRVGGQLQLCCSLVAYFFGSVSGTFSSPFCFFNSFARARCTR